MAHRRTGNATPSSWTNTTPSTSGSATGTALIRRRMSETVNASSVPALPSQAAAVANTATIHDAQNADQNVALIPGTIQIAA